MSKPDAPPAPDYAGAAQQQGAANIEVAKMQNPNIRSPYGNQDVSYDNGNIPTITQTLSPDNQKLLNYQNLNQLGLAGLAQKGIGTAEGVLGTGIDTSKLPSMPVNAGQTASQAMLSRIEPQISQSRELNASTLANQGIPIGSEAYDNSMRVQGQQENDLRLQAAAQGIPMDLQARQQALQEQGYVQNMPLNQITALMSGSQVSPLNFQAQGNTAAAAPTFGAAQAQGQAANNAYNQEVGQYNNMMTGLYGMGAAGIGAAVF